MTSVRHSARLARFVDDSASSAAMAVDPRGYQRIKHEALNVDHRLGARRVFEYINREDIAAEKRKKQQENEANRAAQQQEDEEREAANNAPRFFDLLLKDKGSRSALLSLIAATLLMIALPLTTFYVSYEVFAASPENWRLTYSGFLAVIAVNVVAIGFALYAYQEAEDPETEQEKQERIERDQARLDGWVQLITKGRKLKANDDENNHKGEQYEQEEEEKDQQEEKED